VLLDYVRDLRTDRREEIHNKLWRGRANRQTDNSLALYLPRRREIELRILNMVVAPIVTLARIAP
jgi:hypothetical protein